MKTTIDIPEPLYRQVKVRAAQHGITLRELLLTAIERGLNPPERRDREPHFEIDELGIPVLKRAKEDSFVVTEEYLTLLREQEGV